LKDKFKDQQPCDKQTTNTFTAKIGTVAITRIEEETNGVR